MSALGEKYGIPEETVKRLIKDGIISCSHAKYEEIWQEYKNLSASGKCDGLVVTVAAKTGVSRDLVYQVIHKYR